jgi:hypothetical protein
LSIGSPGVPASAVEVDEESVFDDAVFDGGPFGWATPIHPGSEAHDQLRSQEALRHRNDLVDFEPATRDRGDAFHHVRFAEPRVARTQTGRGIHQRRKDLRVIQCREVRDLAADKQIIDAGAEVETDRSGFAVPAVPQPLRGEQLVFAFPGGE